MKLRISIATADGRTIAVQEFAALAGQLLPQDPGEARIWNVPVSQLDLATTLTRLQGAPAHGRELQVGLWLVEDPR